MDIDNGVILSIFIILIVNLTLHFVCVMWVPDFRMLLSASYLFAYLILIVFCLLWLMKEKITKFIISKDGFSAELKQVQDAKEEIMDIKKEIQNLYAIFLQSYVSLIENSRRWSGWTEERVNEEMQRIENIVKQQGFSQDTIDEIFKDRDYWEKIDQNK